MYKRQWDEWENEFREVVGEMTDEEWGNLDDRLTRMEEQEEGIFAEIRKHSDDISIGSKMTNDKGKIVEITVAENKAVNMAEAQETFAEKWEKFRDSFERYLEERTDDDRRKFNERVKRIPELYKLLRENSGCLLYTSRCV